MLYKGRTAKLREKIIESELEGLFITCPENIYYLTGIENIEGIFFLHPDGAVLFTDSRYFDSIQETNPFFDILQYQNPLKEMADWLTRNGIKKAGFESGHFTVDRHNRYKEAFSEINLTPCLRYVEELRVVKDGHEMELIRQSALIAGEIIDKIPQLVRGMKDMTERDLAIELEYMMKKKGAQKAAFDIIVAAGSRSAFPHSSPADNNIEKEEILLVDCGAVYHGYHSDMTRMLSLHMPPRRKTEEIYHIVREAQKSALLRIAPDTPAKEVDSAAREVIEKAGYKDNFGHGTGHGIGLMVHEEPTINTRNETLLKEGMVFTIEPGIYLPGEFGIRWEDMVAVTKTGYEILTPTKWDNLTPM